MAKKKRKRRKKGRYETGVHESPKLLNGPARYRSGWEVRYMRWLDTIPDVISYEYESIRISYLSNKKTGKCRTYIPDLFVTYADGHKCLVEIKPSRRLINQVVMKKMIVAEEWCNANNASYILVTEITLKELGLL